MRLIIKSYNYYNNNINQKFGCILSKKFYQLIKQMIDESIELNPESYKFYSIDEYFNINCDNCVNCYGCYTCSNCQNCSHCSGCSNCYNSTEKFNLGSQFEDSIEISDDSEEFI